MTVFLAFWIAGQAGVSVAAPPADAREEIACAPASLMAPPLDGMRVMGSYIHGRVMFGPGDAVIVNAGKIHGIEPGQQYFVRRYLHDRFSPAWLTFTPYGVHTAGWVTIVDAKDTMAVAQVTHACDGILEGDYLEPYVAPPAPGTAIGGAPDYEHPGRIVMADEKRQSGFPNLVMLVNRGSDHGIRSGQTFTIFRETLNGLGPIVDIGTGTVLAVRPLTAVVRVDTARDAVFLGDLVAFHRITP
jgi:hypothetical protein